MKNLYQEICEEFEKDIMILEKQIQNQQFLFERNANTPDPIGKLNGGIDPAYSGSVAASAQNRGYITGIQGGNSDAVIANPATISQVSQALSSVKDAAKIAGIDKSNMFDFAQKPSKPILSNNVGLGMGLGMGDQEFSATKEFINKYAGKEFQIDMDQLNDPNEIGYLSWKAVNNAVASKQNLELKQNLEKYGLFSQDNYQNNYPNAINPDYYAMDVSSTFAKKLKATEKAIAGKQKGFSVNGQINKVKK
jgi:hypothetical protein